MRRVAVPISVSPSHSPLLSCCTATDLWDLGGCDRGWLVSVFFRIQQWHLTQYPSRIRFPPPPPPNHLIRLPPLSLRCEWPSGPGATTAGTPLTSKSQHGVKHATASCEAEGSPCTLHSSHTHAHHSYTWAPFCTGVKCCSGAHLSYVCLCWLAWLKWEGHLSCMTWRCSHLSIDDFSTQF